MKNSLTAFLVLCLSVCIVFADGPHDHHNHAHDPEGGGRKFLEPFEHRHHSRLGTPIVHSFGVEPAFTGRDIFGDYHFKKGDGITEHEFELELEWALTRRLGFIVEIPYVFQSEDGKASVDGFGDSAFVLRSILLEKDRFMLTSQIEITAPTGTSDLGGETAIAPGFSAWFDLGNWWTLNTQVAIEHIFKDDVTELLFGLGLVKTLSLAGHFTSDSHGHNLAAKLFNLHLEVTGSVNINGADEGTVNAEALLGLSYGINPNMDVRVGYLFPLSSSNDFDYGLVTGFIWHF